MATTFMTLAAAAFPVSAPATVYTVPSATTARLSEIWLTNNSASAVTVTIWIINSGGSRTNAYKKITETLAPGDWLPIPLNTYLDTGDFIDVDADGADANYRISGLERS